MTECPLGGPRCPESICDCFIDSHPDNPLGIYPEDFVVRCVVIAEPDPQENP